MAAPGPRQEDYDRFFDSADVNGDGSLSLDELVQVLKQKGHNEKEIKVMFKTVDTSGDGLISRQEFQEAMGCIPPEQKTGAAMRTVFRSFDKDGNGFIDKSELAEMFKEMGKRISERELTRMIELMDKNKSGSIDYEEFIQYFSKK